MIFDDGGNSDVAHLHQVLSSVSPSQKRAGWSLMITSLLQVVKGLMQVYSQVKTFYPQAGVRKYELTSILIFNHAT